MEKIVKQEDNYVLVKKGKKDVEKFIAYDGREFDGYGAERKCREYEIALREKTYWSKIEKLDISIPYVDMWFHPKDDQELAVVLHHIGLDNTYDYLYLNGVGAKPETVRNQFKAGDWIGYNYDDGGDGLSSYNIFTVDYIRSFVKEFDKLLGDLTCGNQ
jgi:hypothetical protein